MDILKKNEIYTVDIEGYSSEAYGVCRIAGRAVFVPYAIVGERWEVRIVKVTSAAVYARGERLISPPSASRIDSDCPYYHLCGGCNTRHMTYEEELRFKLSRVNDALTHIGKQTPCANAIIGAENTAHYRNKGILAVAQLDGAPRAGFYKARSHDLVPISRCLLQDELCRRAADAITDFMRAHDIQAYDERTGKGSVRHIFCRRAWQGEDAVVCIVSARGFGAQTPALIEALRRACPELTGIVLNVNKAHGNAVLSGGFYTLFGRPDINDVLCGNVFNISPQAFYQVNPPQAQRLYELALRYAALDHSDLVLELYCGAGTISLSLARAAGRVIGAEIVPQAIDNAILNARANGIENAEFICADAGQAAQALAVQGLSPSVVVVDPPRKGMDEAAVNAIAALSPARVVYVSCNPATLSRDILRLSAHGYALAEVTAVDMFPRTCHVESVALLIRRDAVNGGL